MSLVPMMNNTKWDEIRLGMYELGDLSPKWRTKDVESQYVTEWDGEWFYHFREGGYEFIEWLEIATTSPEQTAAVGAVLQRVRVPGEQVGGIFRVIGYALGQFVETLVPFNTIDPEAEAIIDEIRAAFADVPRGPLSLHQAMCVKYVTADELEEAARLDKDRHWSQIPDIDLENGGRAFYGADRRSWHYLVPAFMVWSLRYLRVNSSFVSDQTIYTFDLAKDEGLRQEALQRFAVLSPPQCQAVCRFLRYMARHGGHADDVVARRALDAYWGRFCEGESP